MLGTIINAALVLVGGAAGLIFKRFISESMVAGLTRALGLCVLCIGIQGAVGTENALCVIVCMVVGAAIGHALHIESGLERGGELLRGKLSGSGSRFTEALVSATLVFCVGAMAITGSLQAGMDHNYTILISKGAIDCVTAASFAAAMGPGVLLSAIPLVIYQGVLTLLAGQLGPLLSAAVVNEMSAVGGVLIAAIGIEMLGLGKERMRVGDMLPAAFLPIAYIPLANWLGGLF